MIFHSYQAIYFHIGKTAGTAVERWLDNSERNPLQADFDKFFGYDRKNGIYLQHAAADFMQQNIDSKVFDQYFKFTVVRNPFERLVSVYHYLIDQHTRQFGSFAAYIDRLPELLASKTNQRGSHHLAQTSYTHVDSKPVCDFIAHFELLPDSLNTVKNKLNVNTELQPRNTHRFYDWQVKPVHEYYDDVMVEQVVRCFANDFRNFNYSLDPTRRRPLDNSVRSVINSTEN